MNLPDERSFNRWFIIISCFVVTALVLWNTNIFFQRLKEDERAKMNIWAKAQEELSNAPEDADLSLILEILNNNTTIPIIHTDENGEVAYTTNLDPTILEDTDNINAYLKDLKGENEPIIIDLGDGQVQYLYYGNSPALNKLKYYPIGLTLIGFLFIGVVYFFYTTTKSSEQNKLWAGMAKETAHQIGTPLSSLIGWTEILKTENINPSYVEEMEKDIDRLRTITERFSKIGSSPNLKETDIVASTKESFEYLKTRSSKLIDFSIRAPRQPIWVMLNEQLYSWTIENLVKNAIDAMRGRGELQIEIKQDMKQAHIYIIDTGKGIDKNKYKSIFEPGQTSKKRGWGLGLSLARRIIEEYHKGKIKVARSEIGKGTTFQISLKKL
ncbi:sensor histidine kinase [Christiangramia forsetii]|uniref:histidine kinase n=2 Tax=Christiangramia forsetii TaxID=411153 RepID=A0M5U4_CHRFK|nr:HAMP domain-containing sensor histidine kinase [Christiangramia forsetii]GGG32150.1 two-component sensor histidine kinase [Christiangramia forsetii]CAL67989.1 two-component system sensor histidine kinase [Christiangramia forsetii KT0803]